MSCAISSRFSCLTTRLETAKSAISEKSGRFVDWIATNSVDFRGKLTAKETDCTITKVAKFAAKLFATLILFIPATICAMFSSAKELFAKKPVVKVEEPVAPLAPEAGASAGSASAIVAL